MKNPPGGRDASGVFCGLTINLRTIPATAPQPRPTPVQHRYDTVANRHTALSW
jgi:hypothetical protein